MKKMDIEDIAQDKYQENSHHTKITSGQSKVTRQRRCNHNALNAIAIKSRSLRSKTKKMKKQNLITTNESGDREYSSSLGLR